LNTISRYLYHTIWTIGAIVLIYCSSFLLDYANEWRSRTLNILGYSLWIPLLVSFVSGIYMAFINGVPKQIRVNRSRLIVFIITFIFLIYFILLFYLSLPVINMNYVRLMNYNGQFFIGLICGYSMITSVFKFINQD
jgi:hypothetical protein